MIDADWNFMEDGQPSPSRLVPDWGLDHDYVWIMEIREQLHAVSVRWGELVIRGLPTTDMTAKIQNETGFAPHGR